MLFFLNQGIKEENFNFKPDYILIFNKTADFETLYIMVCNNRNLSEQN